MGLVDQEPEGEVLFPDPRGEKAARQGSSPVGGDYRYHRPLHESQRRIAVRTIRAWIVRLAGFFRKPWRERDMAEEFESHFQMHVDDYLQAGMSLAEAQRKAALKFGSVDSAKEGIR